MPNQELFPRGKERRKRMSPNISDRVSFKIKTRLPLSGKNYTCLHVVRLSFYAMASLAIQKSRVVFYILKKKKKLFLSN